MAKVLGVEKLEAKVNVALKDKVTKGAVLEEVGIFVKTRIFQFTKRGLSLAGGDNPVSFDKLSDRYKRFRKRYQQWATTGDFFSPPRSNLTLTGQLLNALAFKILKSVSKVEVFVENSARRPEEQIPTEAWVKGKSEKKFRKQKSEPALTNKEVAKRVAENGRPFLGLDRTGRDRVRSMVVKSIRKSLRETGFKK